jgi:light-regulated signal transduction histidine kinase (bacteriophytochrome)
METADYALMKMIKDSAQHMNNLIDDLLTFSRMGRKPIEKKQLDMSLLVQSVIQQLTTGNSYKAEIYTDPLPQCMGDSTMLQQVWVNLIGNALKYSSKKHKPVIHIGTNDVNGQTVYFVKDNG